MESADAAISEDNSVGVGEKRVAEDGVGGEGVGGIRWKRMRNGEEDSIGVGFGEREMRRVAEIVLVLSAMGRMRGGKEPTVAERVMMAEGREKMVAMCGEMAPRDIMPREAFGGVIEDLGLNRLKEVRLGLRPPRLSIVEKMELVKRRMVGSIASAAEAASRPPQRVQAAGVSSDKPRTMPVSSSTMPVGRVSSMTPAAMTFQSRANEVKPSMVSSGSANSNVGRDFPSTAPSRVETVRHRQDKKPNGPLFTPQVPVTSSTEQHLVKHITTPAQTLSAPSTHAGIKPREMEHAQTKVGGNMDVSARHIAPQATNIQTTKPVVAQTAPAVFPGVHQSVQGAHFVQAAPIFNRHVEISKVVQKLLYPKLPEHPSWTPPPRDYMSRILTCQLCKSAINEVDGVLVCDACEKGYHAKCLQSFNQKVIPRGEWHCHRCLSISNGKPFPPKYGRVTRNINSPKAAPNLTAVESSSDQKVETTDQNVSQPNVRSGNSEKTNNSHAGTFAESFSFLKLPEGNEVASAMQKDEKLDSASCLNDASRAEQLTSAAAPAGSSCDRPAQPVGKSESLANSESCTDDVACEEGIASSSPSAVLLSDKPSEPVLKSESLQHENPQVGEEESDALVNSLPPTTSDQLQGSGNHNDIDQQGVTEGAEAQMEELPDSINGVLRPLEKSDLSETNDSTPSHDPKISHREIRGEFQPSLDSEDRLLDVDWIGDICGISDEKKFYQSCSVRGVVYELHDYALIQLGNEKLVPTKLQSMWEDDQTSSKWVTVNRCYFPADLPDSVGHPCAPESNEVYESNHDMTLMAGSIRGPCEVIAPYKFGRDNSQSNHGTQVKAGKCPVFVCKWFYDKIKGVFRPIPS
ncbi:hypothetical protein Dimus_019171 [Dionaea muscipula]